MKTKNIFLLIASVAFVAVAAFMLSSLPVQSIFAKASELQKAAVVEPAVIEVGDEDSTTAKLIVNEAPAAEDTTPTALLTVLADEVKYFDKETGNFAVITDDTMTITEGDCIRTGKDGLAEITFADNITLNLEANTEICATSFAPDTDDKLVTDLQVTLSTGKVFLAVDDPDQQWNIQLLTPFAYINGSSDSHSYSAQLVYPGTEGMTPEELEAYIEKNSALTPKTICVDEEGEKYFCNGCVSCGLLTKITPIKLVVADESGKVSVDYFQFANGFVNKVLNAGETFDYAFTGYSSQKLWKLLCETVQKLANGETVEKSVMNQLMHQGGPQPQPTIVVLPNCGDNVCDIYSGENATTCPADCGG